MVSPPPCCANPKSSRPTWEPNPMSLLSLEGLVVRYGEIEALHGLSLSIDAGEVVTLLGANGAGKSTTLRTISGLLKPAGGQVVFDGKSIGAMSPESIV